MAAIPPMMLKGSAMALKQYAWKMLEREKSNKTGDVECKIALLDLAVIASSKMRAFFSFGQGTFRQGTERREIEDACRSLLATRADGF